MEELLMKVGSQAATFAIRSGIGFASKLAFSEISKYIQGAPIDASPELETLKRRLENKIKIVTPAIDLIERIAARGNTSLVSTVQLTTTLRQDINAFARRISDAMEAQSATQSSKAATALNIKNVTEDMKDLLRRIEDAVPLISLALTTSGANFSTSLPDTVSPSRLLQASSIVRDADHLFSLNHSEKEVQVGPTFTLRFYSIFSAHSRINTIKDILWKEEFAKCRVSVMRVPSAIGTTLGHNGWGSITFASEDSEIEEESYEYELRVAEDLDDGRYHEELEEWTQAEKKAYKSHREKFIEGRVKDFPVHKISRLFYEHAGMLLNLGESLAPVLIAKINHAAPHPRSVFEKLSNLDVSSKDGIEDDETLDGRDIHTRYESDDELKGLAVGEIEWVAFEVFEGSEEEDQDEEEEDNGSQPDSEESSGTIPANISEEDELSSALISKLSLSSPSQIERGIKSDIGPSSLSLLEYILRLSALQTFEQQNHINLSDEHLVLFLRDDNPMTRQAQSQEVEALARKNNRFSVSSEGWDMDDPRLRQSLPLSPPTTEDKSERFASSSTRNSPYTKDRPRSKGGLEKAFGGLRRQVDRPVGEDDNAIASMTPPPRHNRTIPAFPEKAAYEKPQSRSASATAATAPSHDEVVHRTVDQNKSPPSSLKLNGMKKTSLVYGKHRGKNQLDSSPLAGKSSRRNIRTSSPNQEVNAAGN